MKEEAGVGCAKQCGRFFTTIIRMRAHAAKCSGKKLKEAVLVEEGGEE